jgi:hypothetical protein
MNKKIVIALFSLVVLVLLALLIFSGGGSGDKEEMYTNWKSKFDFKSKEPQDLGILKSLIQKHTKDSVFILDNFNQLPQIKNKEKASFIFIGDAFYMPDSGFKKIKKYIDSGATMLLSFDKVNGSFYDHYFEGGAYTLEYNDKLYQWVGDTSLRYCSVYQNDTIYDDWTLFNKKQIKDTNYRAYMFAINQPTAFYVKSGKGSIHFHANPRLFQNYQVLTRNGYAHASAWLKWIPKNENVIIMKFAVPPVPPDPSDGDADNDLVRDTSYLQFIIQNEALRNAFLFAIGLIFLFLVFRTKRRENVLNGVEATRNMSVVFVETLSSIYLAKNSPASVLKIMRRNFYSQMNRHFYIDLTRTEKQKENLERLIEKSGYPAEKINDIMKAFGPAGAHPDNASLGVLYRKIDDFYKATGIRKDYDKVFIQGRGIEIYKSPVIGGLALVASILILFKGMQLLRFSDGLGIVLAILGGFFIFLSIRLIMLPVIKMNDEKIVKFNFIFGKKTIFLNQTVSTNIHDKKVEFNAEDGTSFNVYQQLLSKRSKHNLSQIIAYLKRKTL